MLYLLLTIKEPKIPLDFSKKIDREGIYISPPIPSRVWIVLHQMTIILRLLAADGLLVVVVDSLAAAVDLETLYVVVVVVVDSFVADDSEIVCASCPSVPQAPVV